MKTTYTLIATLLFSQLIFATNIPDANFEQALINLGYDSGTPDGTVPTTNIASITNLNVNNQNISDLTGIEDFTSLINLFCVSNQLTNLNVSSNTNLVILNCDGNLLTSLDLSNNLSLRALLCQFNQLTSLDLSQNTMLAGLDCYGNQLTELDLSLNVNLDSLGCANNLLTCLNIKNGNNLNMGKMISVENPLLVCIEVDDATWSATNWTNIDPASNFDTNCNVSCSSATTEISENTVEINIYPNPTKNYFTIETQQPQLITVYSVLGKEILTNNINSSTVIDLSELPSGIYFLNATNDHGVVSTKKIIKQ